MALVIADATIIDPAADGPAEGSLLIEDGRIAAVGRRDDFGAVEGAETIDARGKYVIPGLMNANVHLLIDIYLENLVRNLDRFEDLIAEAAQVALRNGLTTVFDTWGPRRALMATRDRIATGEIPGARIFCAGNIIGFDGPYSRDFYDKVNDVATAPLTRRINATWVENTGRHLMWLTPARIAEEVREYAATGIDFVKYASNEHGPHSAGAFLQFSAEAQKAIVDEAHRAGLTAQAHSMSIEGARLAIEAGCDLITHCNITGPEPYPESMLRLFVDRNVGAVIFPWTETGFQWLRDNVADFEWTFWQASDANARALIEAGATLLLANDAGIFHRELRADPNFAKSWSGSPEDDSLISLASGHFYWFKAMEEKGCPPLEMLRAATRNIAAAYRKDDLGTLEVGKVADVLVLDKDPLSAAENYRSISTIVKDGTVVDHEALPLDPVLTVPMFEPADEEARYVTAFTTDRAPTFPTCTSCLF